MKITSSIKEFVKKNKVELAYMGVIAITYTLVPCDAFASDAANALGTGASSGAATTKPLGMIETPLRNMLQFVSGPLAGVVTVGSLITGLTSYQMGWEQSITKKCGVGCLCGAGATQAENVCTSLGVISAGLNF